MTDSVRQRLDELGISLPEPAPALANYVPYLSVDNVLYISGQLPLRDGKPVALGRLGESIDVERGAELARLCAINIIAQVGAALGGDFNRLQCCAKLTGFVNCTADFTQQPQVINGASDLMVAVFGDTGRHTRSAVGVNVLPLGCPVEVDAVFHLC